MKVVFVTTALLLIAQSWAQMLFDCRRDGTTCGNTGVCQQTDGKCATCGTGFQGFDCNEPATPTACGTNNCQNSGICYNDGVVDRCYCTEEFWGTTCDVSRVKHVCGLTSTYVQIVPHGSFANGKVFIEGKEADAACVFDAASTGRDKTIDYTACGIQPDTTTAAPSTLYTFSVIVQYNKQFKTGLDQKITITCKKLADGSIATLDAAITSAADTTGLIEGKVENEIASGVTMVMYQGGTTTALVTTSPLALGTPVDLAFILDTSKGFKDFEVKSVTATDGATTPETMAMVSTGCADLASKAILTAFKKDTTDPAKTKITLSFKTFKFLNTANLKFNAEVKVCQTACTAATCDATKHIMDTGNADFMNGIGRKKRQVATTEKTELHKMNVTFMVWDPTNSGLLGTSNPTCPTYPIGSPTSVDCLGNIVFLLPLILLAVMLLVSMAMTVFFCNKVSEKRRDAESNGYNNGAYVKS